MTRPVAFMLENLQLSYIHICVCLTQQKSNRGGWELDVAAATRAIPNFSMQIDQEHIG